MSFQAAYDDFLSQTQFPEKAQAENWRRIWDQIKKAPFWHENAIRHTGAAPDLSEFPITDYSDYQIAIEKSFAAGISELSGDPVIFWCESSGSSGKRKVFPITEAYRAEFQKITPPQTFLLMKNFPKFLSEPFLFFVATKPAEVSPSGIEVGFISHYNYRNIPKLLAKNYGFPIEVFADSETFRRWGALYALATNLSAMAAITPSMIAQLGENICAQINDYWPYLEGQTPVPSHLPQLQITPGRLAHLKDKLAQIKPGDTFSYQEVWPALQFITCWKSASCGLQLPTLQKWLQNKIPVVEGAFCATEGWLTVPFGKDTELGTVLHPGSHIVEFALAGSTPNSKNLLQAWQLKEGQSYEIFLTTSMGMIRYRIRDIMRCNGYFNRSPVLEFLGKSGSMVSIGQTRVNEEHLLSAMSAAKFAPLGQWIFGMSKEGDGLVFYTDQSGSAQFDKLSQIDSELSILNSEYESDLKTGLLKPIRTVVLPVRSSFWEPGRHAQSKPRILTSDSPKIEN